MGRHGLVSSPTSPRDLRRWPSRCTSTCHVDLGVAPGPSALALGGPPPLDRLQRLGGRLLRPQRRRRGPNHVAGGHALSELLLAKPDLAAGRRWHHGRGRPFGGPRSTPGLLVVHHGRGGLVGVDSNPTCNDRLRLLAPTGDGRGGFVDRRLHCVVGAIAIKVIGSSGSRRWRGLDPARSRLDNRRPTRPPGRPNHHRRLRSPTPGHNRGWVRRPIRRRCR